MNYGSRIVVNSILCFACSVASLVCPNMAVAQDGPMVTFDIDPASVTLHEPAYAVFAVRNTRTEPVQFDLGFDRKEAFRFAIVRPDGRRVAIPKKGSEGFGRVGKVSVRAGETYTQRLLLNEWYAFDSPGDYTIEISVDATFTTPSGRKLNPSGASVVRSLTVLPRNASVLERICRGLAEAARSGDSVEAQIEAARSLAYVQDPVAVPSPVQVLRTTRALQIYAVDGLARIGDQAAVDALISALSSNDAELKSAVTGGLKRIEAGTRDQAVRNRIQTALRQP